ncbi:MAG: class I SAM-dependent methyltransferase [Candidatus Aminicenantes bacterium]|nr:class I SAM-dependent methyltransferase [Candidatus Aminicenantes bacterium]MDH5706253.1 class I SAM-dependent methyltransferase [Candidatus Aminicenantes bacterium]
MNKMPEFRKNDRYKRSSFRAYNWKMPPRYDSCIWLKLGKVDLLDDAVLREISNDDVSIRILDIGCATGRLLYKLAKHGYTNLSGVDLAPRIIEVARNKLSPFKINLNLKTADSEDHLPWPDNSFDVITLTGVIHHFYRLDDALKEACRVLDKDGKLIIWDPWFPVIIRQIVNSWLYFFPHDGDYRFYTPKKVENSLQETGLKNTRYRKIGFWTYIITGEKSS